MRHPKARIKWFLSHRPPEVGLCLRHTWQATDIPAAGSASAAEAVAYIRDHGHLHEHSNAPKGAWVLWTGGSNGYGHAALAMSRNRIASTDVKGPATVGVVDESWPSNHWGLHYAGWSDWYGVPFTVGPAWRRHLHTLRRRIARIRRRHRHG